MLEITERAADALRSMAADMGSAHHVRIDATPAVSNGQSPQFRVELIDVPEPSDEKVISPEGIDIWLAGSAAAFLEDTGLAIVRAPRGMSGVPNRRSARARLLGP
jgi:Fe-S cluster assembly iron-binding protein IscA